MPAENAAAAGQEGEGGGTSMTTTIMRSVGIFLLVQFAMKQFQGNSSTTGAGRAAGNIGKFAERPDVATIANYSQIPFNLAPIWAEDSDLDLRVYVSPALQLPLLASLPSESLIVSEDNFKMGDLKYSKEWNYKLDLPREVQRNGSFYAHIYAGLHGSQLDPLAKSYDPSKAAHYIKQLNHYLPKKKVRKERNLLDKNEVIEEEPEDKGPPVISSHWHSNFSLALIPNNGIVNWRSMHPGLRQDIVMEPTAARDASGQDGWYYPVFFLNKFWQLKSQMIELNETVKSVDLNINLYQLSPWKYSILASMDEGAKQQANAAAFGTENPNPMGGDGECSF